MSEAEPTRDTHRPTGETGRRLREAREAKHQSVTEVAECLHLRPSIVSAIEDGDYRQIPGELFLKGYVKSYARHVGLDEESTIQILDRELEPLREEDERARIEHPLEEIQRRKEQRRRAGRWLVVVAVIVVAVIAYVAYTQFGGRFLHHPAGVSSSAPATQSQTGDTGADGQGQATTESTPSQTSETSAPAVGTPQAGQGQPAAETRPSSSVNASPKDQEQTPASATTTAPKQAASPESPAAGQKEGAVAAAASNTSQATSQSSTNQTYSGQYQGSTLTGTFGGDCWVEVKNGDGVEVVAALKRAGDKMYYRGPAPFHVVLGAVSQVTQMTYNGKPVDLKQYPAPGNRAEFVLGKKKD